ncbi:MAG: hypothetical protein R3B91_05970 [Planctomycetaceae bacterium]
MHGFEAPSLLDELTAANQSSNAGWVGQSPITPKSLDEATIPRPVVLPDCG